MTPRDPGVHRFKSEPHGEVLVAVYPVMFSTPLNEYRPIDFVLPSPAGLFINEHGTDRQEWGSMRTTGKHSPKMVFARDRWGEPSRLVNPSVARRSSRPSLGPGGRGSHLVLASSHSLHSWGKLVPIHVSITCLVLRYSVLATWLSASTLLAQSTHCILPPPVGPFPRSDFVRLRPIVEYIYTLLAPWDLFSGLART